MISRPLGEGHGKQRVGAVDKGRSGSHRHQGVHIGRPVEKAGKTVDKKLLVDDHNNDGQQHLVQTHRHMVFRENFRQRPVPHHMSHGDIHQRNQKYQRRDQTVADCHKFPVLRCPQASVRIFRISGCNRFPVFALAALRLEMGAVPGLLHRLNDRLRRRRSLHVHGVGQKAYRHLADALHFADRLLHMRAAGRAAHAGHIITFHI